MLTGVVLARNEESQIVDCLQHLAPHVEEILLIDMESSDRTVELARPFVRDVLPHPLIAHFDAARNVAISAARHEWLWFVDADEQIPAKTGELVRRLLRERGHEFEALEIPFKSYFCGQWMQHCGWWPGFTGPRVLKKGYFRFREKLHGGVQVFGSQHSLPADPELGVDHFSYGSVEHYLEKLNRYTSTEALQLAEDGRRWDWREAMAHMLHDLWQYYEQHPGRRDGERGWILSWLSGQYRWLSHAKLIDQVPPASSEGAEISAPVNLDDVLLFLEEELSALRARRPQLPLGLVWRSPIWDASGYADEGRTFAKALARGERPLVVEEIPWNDQRCALPEDERTLLRALIGRRRAPSTVTMTDCLPPLVKPDRCATVNVLRTTYETDRVPPDWLAHLRKFDEVWCTSDHAATSFRRSGVPPERIRTVPSCIDTSVYHPHGPQRPRPPQLKEAFLFLSVFEWQLRKGWDVLLRAFAEAFAVDEGMGLLLKISRLHGQSRESLMEQADQVLRSSGVSLGDRADIVLLDEMLSAEEMVGLYRSADAFVLASRGEGWGRPYMEAMACGLPTIGTRATGQLDFMHDKNSLLIDAVEVPVSEEAARELPPYSGHRWYEPDASQLAAALRQVAADAKLRQRLSRRAVRDIHGQFSLDRGREAVEAEILRLEERLVTTVPPPPKAHQIGVVLEGEFFAEHSFANINEQLALGFLADDDLALALNRRRMNPIYDVAAANAHRLRPYFDRELDARSPQILIRHAFPPNFAPPGDRVWVHIQPWEFGYLPEEWVEPLRDRVHEIWAPSQYVQRVYQQSGIPPEKIHVIPWGVDPQVFQPTAPGLHLPTEKTFCFLFVGGSLLRKGIDILLEAYLAEFTRADDVALVIKDMGTSTFYRFGNERDRIQEAQAHPDGPEILYIDASMTFGQLASLYTACHCLVAPYRGEGFGLPILEAMACGLPPIVPHGGASDDFVTSRTGMFIPAQTVETTHDQALVGPPQELQVKVEDLRSAMRRACDDRERTGRLGAAAARRVKRGFTWNHTLALMKQRLRALAECQPTCRGQPSAGPPPGLAACIRIGNCERTLADCLARVRTFVDEIVVFDDGCTDRSATIAREYGAQVVDNGTEENHTVRSPWYFWLDPRDRLEETDARQLREIAAAQGTAATEVTMRLQRSRVRGGGRRLGDRLVLRRRDQS